MLLGIHMVANHFVVESVGGLRSYHQVLEYIANQAASQALAKIAQGVPGASLTRKAQAAELRMRMRQSATKQG